MEHPNASAVRRFLTAWFQGDHETWRPLVAEDAATKLSVGAAEGQPASVEIDDVFADDNFAVAIVKVGYERPDGPIELSYACAQRIDGAGKICEVWKLSDNRAVEHLLFPPKESRGQV